MLFDSYIIISSLRLHVFCHSDAPRLPLVSLIPSGEIKEGILLTLTCSSDANPAANYTWFKENEESPSCSRQNFTISNIGQQHTGLYYCEALNRRGSHKSAIHFAVVSSESAKALCSHTRSMLELFFFLGFSVDIIKSYHLTT